jgi:hypothetical protein
MVTCPSGTAPILAITSSTRVDEDRSWATTEDLAPGDELYVRPGAASAYRTTSIDIVQPSVMGTLSAVSGETISFSGPDTTSYTAQSTQMVPAPWSPRAERVHQSRTEKK